MYIIVSTYYTTIATQLNFLNRIVNTLLVCSHFVVFCLLRPIDVVRSFHNALRRDIFQIDNSLVSAARNGGNLSPIFDRLHFMGEVLDFHAQGEEAAVFPAVDKVAPLVAEAYLMDHRELDKMVEALEIIRKAPDALETARATAILGAHLRIHLDKEDAHLYRILREKTTDEEQAVIGQTMSRKVPPEKFPSMINWLFPLLGLNDQVVVAKIWMMLMPPQVFANIKPLIKSSVANNWQELVKQVPGI